MTLSKIKVRSIYMCLSFMEDRASDFGLTFREEAERDRVEELLCDLSPDLPLHTKGSAYYSYHNQDVLGHSILFSGSLEDIMTAMRAVKRIGRELSFISAERSYEVMPPDLNSQFAKAVETL